MKALTLTFSSLEEAREMAACWSSMLFLDTAFVASGGKPMPMYWYLCTYNGGLVLSCRVHSASADTYVESWLSGEQVAWYSGYHDENDSGWVPCTKEQFEEGVRNAIRPSAT